jgi:hypothetical protein
MINMIALADAPSALELQCAQVLFQQWDICDNAAEWTRNMFGMSGIDTCCNVTLAVIDDPNAPAVCTAGDDASEAQLAEIRWDVVRDVCRDNIRNTEEAAASSESESESESEYDSESESESEDPNDNPNAHSDSDDLSDDPRL